MRILKFHQQNFKSIGFWSKNVPLGKEIIALQDSMANSKSLYKKVTIYYFSGTGNAKAVAGWFADVASEQGIECSVINIAGNGKKVNNDPGTLVGFSSPTHGFNFPPITLKFLWHFPRGRNCVFILNTRAGMKLWKLHLVGLSGIAQLFAAIVLLIKGYKIVGMRPVDLPSNWISIHPGLRKRVVSSMFTRCEKSIRKFACKLLNGKRDYRALYDIIQDLAIAPVALGYYFIGRYVLAKSFIASNSCTLCRSCINSCPVKAIIEIGQRPFWTFRCESCMKCMNSCPERAIQTAHGLVIGGLYLFFTLGLEGIYFLSVDRIPEGLLSNVLGNGIVKFTIASALAIPFLWFSYRIVHYLLRFAPFEWLVVHTSFTFYKFWRRYKGRGKTEFVE